MLEDINDLIQISKVYIDTSSLLDDRFTGLYDSIYSGGKIYTTSANINEIKRLSHSHKKIASKAAIFYNNFLSGEYKRLIVEKCDLEPGVHADIYIRNRISISRMHSTVFLIAEDNGLLHDVDHLNHDASVDGYCVNVGSLGSFNSPCSIKIGGNHRYYDCEYSTTDFKRSSYLHDIKIDESVNDDKPTVNATITYDDTKPLNFNDIGDYIRNLNNSLHKSLNINFNFNA